MGGDQERLTHTSKTHSATERNSDAPTAEFSIPYFVV